jgi:AraC-like DNA-binding protein
MVVSGAPIKYRPAPLNIVDVSPHDLAQPHAGAYLFEGDDPGVQWHFHDMHQIQYAFEGIAEVETATARYVLPPRQAAWIPAGLPHRTALRGVRAVAVFFDPAMVQGADDRVRVLAAAPVIREMLLYATRWPLDRAAGDATAESFFETLALLTRDWLDRETPLCLPTSTDQLLQAAMDYTQAHLFDVTVTDVCGAIGVSVRTLRRRFTDTVGMSWREYVLQSRLLRAMVLLTESDRSVLEVAIEVGFDSVSAFTRAFRRITDETPSAYRRRVAAPLDVPQGACALPSAR